MPVFKDTVAVLDSAQTVSQINVVPTLARDNATEFYGKLSTGLKNLVQNLMGDAGTKLNFDAIVNHANLIALAKGRMGELPRVGELLNSLNQSRTNQGNLIRQALDEYKDIKLAVITGNITPELQDKYGDLPKSLAGLQKEMQLTKLEDWKRSRLDGIERIGNGERNSKAAELELAKKPAVVDYITESITTRYMIEYPQRDKASIQSAIADNAAKIWDTAYGQVYGSKPFAMN
jgi:hypothetical protein